MTAVLIINGPNLNMLGTREVSIYGALSLRDIEVTTSKKAADLGMSCTSFQSNAEHEIVERIHACQQDGTDFIIINPAAFTHTSVAIRDALLAVNKPFIEVHLSNVHAREAFRQHSYLSDKAQAVITGCGALGYHFALEYAHEFCANKQQKYRNPI